MFTVIMGVSLVLLSPVDSDKRKLDKQQKRKYRKVVCVLVLFFLAFTVGLKEIHMEKDVYKRQALWCRRYHHI